MSPVTALERPGPTSVGAAATDPIAFADAYLPLNERAQPWTLSRHQRRVLARLFGRHFPLRVWSEMKKSGKTFLAAVLVLWWGFTHANTEIVIAANDLEQSQGRVFRTLVALLKANPALGASATILAREIRLSNSTVITAIASDYRGAAGSRHSLVVFDELWGYDSETAQRLYEELTPPPTEPDAWVLVVTYAGFTNESTLLESIYQRGVAGQRVDNELEIYESDGLVMFWSHTARQPWQTPEYYAEQRRSLRPNTYLRLHENRWVSAESSFLLPEFWDGCVAPEWGPCWPTKDIGVFVGVDAATKHDCCAVVGVLRDDEQIVLAWHRIWRNTPQDPLDLCEVEQYVLEQAERFHLMQVLVDPFQMARSVTALRAAGIPVVEYPQTVSNLTRMAEAIYEAVKSRTLVVYPSAELREHALNAVVVDSGRGIRLAKDKTSKKIDGLVALAMATIAAIAGTGGCSSPRGRAGTNGSCPSPVASSSASQLTWRPNDHIPPQRTACSSC